VDIEDSVTTVLGFPVALSLEPGQGTKQAAIHPMHNASCLATCFV